MSANERVLRYFQNLVFCKGKNLLRSLHLIEVESIIAKKKKKKNFKLLNS